VTDKSAIINKKEALVNFLYCRLPESMDSNSYFCNLIELYNTQVASIVEMFLNNLHSNGFEDEFLL
jgi:hypothetical protein